MKPFFLLCLLLLAAPGPGAAVPSLPERVQIQLLLNTDNAAALRRSRWLLRQAAPQSAAQAEGYWLLGCALRNYSRFDSSLYCGQQALTLFRRLGRPTGVANAYCLLAQTYKRLADAQHVPVLTRKALALAGQAVAAARQGPDSLVLARAYLLQGIVYRDLRRYPAARACYRRGIALARRWPGQPSPLPVGYANLGQLLMDADGNLPAAIGYFRRALPLYRSEGNRNGLEHAYRNLSWAYRRQGRPALALATADTSLALARALADPHRLVNALQTAYLAAKAAGRLPQALALLEEFKASTDALTTADIAQAVAARQATYELARQQARIAALGRANARQRQLLGGLTAGAALLLALLAVAGGQYRTIRRTNARLRATNQTVERNHRQLAQQADQLATLLREVHHRVKNNLAVVAGLLRLQARRLPDPAAARAVRESQQRVEALSLVHQSLYLTDDVTAVDMPRYVADLVQSLAAAYNLPPAAFDLTLAVAPLHLDADRAGPLGLLLNELLTNAFKYALGRPGTGRPALRVALGPAPGGGLLLEVQDNGPGFDAAATGRGTSFGHRLVAALAGQLGAELTLDATGGTHYRLLLPPAAA